MKKTLPGILILFYILTSTATAQQTTPRGALTGKVTDKSKRGLAFANVSLHKQSDSSLLKGTITDESGRFQFSHLIRGNYYLVISNIGYRSFTSAAIQITETSATETGEFSIEQAPSDLGTVTVSAKKTPPLLKQFHDRIVVNVENSILSAGNTALELLEKSPGVSVDEEGNISLKGKQGVKIMINGKLSYLSQKELVTLLRGMPSGSISELELITQPSAKFDAAGNAGLINIKLKKTDKQGFNGTVNSTYGRGQANRASTGINLNYSGEKINIFGSYDYAYRGEKESFHFIRNFYEGSPIHTPDRASKQNSSTNEPLNTHNYKAGIDFTLNQKNVFGLLLNGNSGTYENYSQADNRIAKPNGVFISDARTDNRNKEYWQGMTYNLNYQHRFTAEGKELSADIDYSRSEYGANQLLKTLFHDEGGAHSGYSSLRRGDIPSLTDVYVAKVDYTLPLKNKSKIETGWKSSFVKADNNAQYDTLRNDQWIPDALTTNRFIYKEQIHAGYISFNKTFRKTTIQAGIRGEQTSTTGHQITTDSLVNRNYFQLFPSLSLGQKINENNRLQLSYSRRIERPDYDDLNPFRFFRDPYLYFEGNPFLQPELIHSIELSHTFRSRITTAINYSHTSDAMTWIMGQVDSINTTSMSPQNLSRFINYGMSVTVTTPVTRWWTNNSFFNVYNNAYQGEVKNGQVENKMVSFALNSQHNFQIRKGFSAELSGLYESKSVYGAFTKRSSWFLSAGVQHQVLQKKGNIKLAVTDLFRTKRFDRISRYENVDMHEWAKLDSRILTVSFSYRFGKQSIGPGRTRKTGSEDVQNRVKGGG